jgi:hypothetical protein
MVQHWLEIASWQIMTPRNVLCRNRPLLPMDCNVDNSDDDDDVGAGEKHSFYFLDRSSAGSFVMLAAKLQA